jgi:hypothetical protein
MTDRAATAKSSFDGWSIEARLERLPAEAGRLDFRVQNASDFHALVDDTYARCYNGAIANLAPGRHTIHVQNMWLLKHVPWRKERPCDFEAADVPVTVVGGRTSRVDAALRLNPQARAWGWDDPVGIAHDYPYYRHRPHSGWNWADGAPSVCVDRAGGRTVVVWSYLDDLWLAAGGGNAPWQGPQNLDVPVNSAHRECQPVLIQDRDGRHCLLFLSDRGDDHVFGSHVSWSKDLKVWTPPVPVAAGVAAAHDLVQRRDGQYVHVSRSPEQSGEPGASASSRSFIAVRRSRDLADWTEPADVPESALPDSLCLRQDTHGVCHLVYAANGKVYHRTTSDFAAWSEPAEVPHRLRLPASHVAADIIGDRLVVTAGMFDGMYAGYETLDALWRGVSAGSEW